jgi:hypothetical protein
MAKLGFRTTSGTRIIPELRSGYTYASRREVSQCITREEIISDPYASTNHFDDPHTLSSGCAIAV